MKSKVLYTCEICHTDYKNKKTLRRVKSIILKIVTQRSLPYSQDRSGFPITIEVENEDGKRVIYKR